MKVLPLATATAPAVIIVMLVLGLFGCEQVAGDMVSTIAQDHEEIAQDEDGKKQEVLNVPSYARLPPTNDNQPRHNLRADRAMAQSPCVTSIINAKFGDFPNEEPQKQALAWLKEDISDDECDDDEKMMQRYILAVFYFSTGGDNWKKNYKWGGNKLWLSSGDECFWGKVTCENGKVTHLKLFNNNLVGTIPRELYELEHLKKIALQKNHLSGGLDPKLFDLQDLEVLHIHENSLTGPIPDTLSGCTSPLKWIDMGSNSLTGTIPEIHGDSLQALEEIYLDNNKLEGRLDPKLFELPNLRKLDLSVNNFTGIIPNNYGSSSSLVSISLFDNSLSGIIPDITGDSLQNIEELQLYKNKMALPVPEGLCALRSSKPDQFKILGADCAPPDNAQNPCSSDCCTYCTVGKGTIHGQCAEKAKYIIGSKFGQVVDESPQGQALDWLISDIGDDDNCDNDDKIVQRFVLAAFYFSTGGDGWVNNSGWLGNGDACAWKGLTCNGNKALTKISLASNNLKGTIVDEINALEHLHYLRLGNNALTGPIPNLSGLINLQHFYAYRNGLTGRITDQFEGMTKLTYLNLGNNALTGTVPVMTGFTALESFFLYGNELTGQITDQFEGLTKLKHIQLNSNALTGTIPNMRGLSYLDSLKLEGNNFTGQITSQFEGMRSLRIIFLGSNALTGNIPDFSANTRLRTVQLSSNNFDGGLDPALFELPRLQGLFLNNNKLTGPIPDNFSQSNELVYLYLNNNKLTGPIPDNFSQSNELVHLILNNNKLTGPIPDNFGGSTTLKKMWLDNNFLTGTIPDITGDSLKSIDYLRLQQNKLSGPVPDSLCALQPKYLEADCAPRGNAQNECPPDCCTECFRVGKGVP